MIPATASARILLLREAEEMPSNLLDFFVFTQNYLFYLGQGEEGEFLIYLFKFYKDFGLF